MVELSVVVPVYGCNDCLHALHSRLRESVESVTRDYEIVLVDDGSPDGAWETLRSLADSDPHVKAVRLSRNFGQHAAITAGLSESSGAWVVVMDCDLQDRPEEIPRLYAKAHQGYDIVLCRRTIRRQVLVRRLAGSGYYRLANWLLKADIDTNYTNLSIISRKVVDAYMRIADRDRLHLLVLNWLGFPRAVIEVEPAERFRGRSSYGFSRLARVAVDGLFFQSTVLLRWIVYAGFLLAFLGFLLAAYTGIVYVTGGPLPDWTALPMLILLLSGFVIFSTGVTGLYIGKIFDQVKGRPLYVVDERLGAGPMEFRGASAPLPDDTDVIALGEHDRMTS